MYQQAVCEVISKVLLGHSCCMNAEDPSSMCTVVKVRCIAVISAARNFVLHVPTHQCKACKKILTVPPCAVNCGPTTPTDACETWITDEALHLFRDVHLNNGLSAGGKF
jgi:hypothetical protein